MAKKITLREWARLKFEKPPCDETLRRWARDCKIYPHPEKSGLSYYVDPNARYINPADPNSYVSQAS